MADNQKTPAAAPAADAAPAAEDLASKTARSRAEARDAKNAAGKVLTLVTIKHGSYWDHAEYKPGDIDQPPATKGDTIRVPRRVADRLVRDGIADIHL